MALTRAQLLSGDASQGKVLAGQVQGVKKGAGILIASDGTISFDYSSATGVVKTNSSSAFNDYEWPSASPNDNTFLVSKIENNAIKLEWNPVTLFGLGLLYSPLTGNLKVSIPAETTPPTAGTGLQEAEQGSMYWDSSEKRLFIRNSGAWEQASYGPDSFNVELLTGKYHIYVNPDIGSDLYVTGMYPTLPGDTPVTNQEAKWGYTPSRPFKTIQRALLEVARVQASLPPGTPFDRSVIHCSAGEHIIYNDLGSVFGLITGWANNTTPSFSDLQKLNSAVNPGVILPRGVSIIGEDYRKTVIRPDFVPDSSGDIENDRASIFRVTGGCFFFNFTFKDKIGHPYSHHLLECFSFVTDADLVDYYNKTQVLFSLPSPSAPSNPGETEIVAPFPPPPPSSTTDGIVGASPYIFSCAVRSVYGLCGINADGNGVLGFKSIVVAQFTGVSLQKDLNCWQRYNTVTKEWVDGFSSYPAYIGISPNDVRMNPAKRSFHIRAVNNAFIQEVSVFAIGQGVHHWAHSGGEITITNSNSTFGGCAAISEGYKTEAFPQDTEWQVSYINRSTNLVEDVPVITRIYLGTIDSGVANNATTIVLTENLIESELYPGIPDILAASKYTFKEDSYLWVENPIGYDFRAPLALLAWDPLYPDRVLVKDPMENQNLVPPGGVDGGITQPNLAGSRLYIRRFVDTRDESRRKYSLDISNSDPVARTPLRDYVLQTSPGRGSVTATIPDNELLIVNTAASIPPGNLPALKRSQIVIERGNANNNWTSGYFYRPGDTVKRENKHFTCVLENHDIVFDEYKWNESYVHMASGYNAYDFFLNVAPVIIFDNDTDGNETTVNCGYNLTTMWTTDLSVIGQYRSATDYRGVHQFLVAIGFTSGEADTILTPSTNAQRKLNPTSSIDMDGYTPSSGVATALANWGIEFRRPSIVRMFGHAWEWSGYLNYTKALPPYQGELSQQNQFTYFFTNDRGGKAYATGYNQEGYLVTPGGLTDLNTNATTSVANLGSPNQGQFPNSFDSLTVGNLTVNTSISGSPTFAPQFYTNLLTPGLGIDFSAPPLIRGVVPVLEAPPLLNNSPTGGISTSSSGSLYWDSNLGDLFIAYFNGGTPVWVKATSAANDSISPGIIAAKGDLIAGQAPGVPSNLSVGTNGQVLTANSAQPLGLSWATLPSATPTVAGLISLNDVQGNNFPSGTRLAFNNAVPPTGWTLETGTNYNDVALRLVTSTGGGSGGTTVFSTAFGSFNTGNTTLAAFQIPAHTHNYDAIRNNPGPGAASGSAAAYESGVATIANTPSDGAHAHPVSINVKYVDFIIASKN